MDRRARAGIAGLAAAAMLTACEGPGSSDGTAPPARSTLSVAPSLTSPSTSSESAVNDAEIQVGSGPGYATVGAGSVWVGNHVDGTVSRIDPSTDEVIATVEIEGEPTGMLFAFDAVWTFGALTGLLHRIDPATDQVVAQIRLEGKGGAINGIASDGESVWVSENSGSVYRIDPVTDTVLAEVEILEQGCGPGGNLTFDFGAVWYACSEQPHLWKINPATERVERTIEIGGEVGSPAAGDGMVWVPTMSTGVVRGLDAVTGRVQRQVRVGNTVEQLRIEGSTMWARISDTELAEVDLRRLKVVERFELPAAPIPGGGIALGFGSVWVMNFGTGTVWRIRADQG